jgi:FkbM family methyltransferase
MGRQGAKIAARRAVGRALDRLPASWFASLRETHAATRPGGLTGLALKAARYRPLPVDVFEDFAYPGTRFAAADSVVLSQVYWFGGDAYEGAETAWWRRCCQRASHVLELGANVGFYTVHGATANPAVRYAAVEPHPVSAAGLRRNLDLNQLTNVEVVEAAVVGAVTSPTVTLAVPVQDGYGAPAGAFVPEGGEGVDGIGTHRSVEVPVVAAADLIEGVDLLKLDIEGHESEVLGAVFEHLLAQRPTIFLEVRSQDPPRLREIVVDLVAHGYVVFAIGTTSLHLVPGDVVRSTGPLPRFGSRDLLLVPAEGVADL